MKTTTSSDEKWGVVEWVGSGMTVKPHEALLRGVDEHTARAYLQAMLDALERYYGTKFFRTGDAVDFTIGKVRYRLAPLPEHTIKKLLG